MPLPVLYIGQKQPGPLHFLMQGLGQGIQQGMQQSRQSKALQSIFGDCEGGQCGSPQASMSSLQKILTTPMDPQTRSFALQAWQAQTSFAQKQQAQQMTLSPQQKSQILSAIPEGTTPQQMLQMLMENGMSQKDALDIMKQLQEHQKSEQGSTPRQRAKDVQDQWNNLIKDVQDKSKGAFGGTAFRQGSVDRKVLDAQIRHMRQLQQEDMRTVSSNPNAPLRLNNIQAIRSELDQIENGIRQLESATKTHQEKEEQSFLGKLISPIAEPEQRKLDLNNPADVEIGLRLLQEANGDIELAKKLAKQRGYLFD